MCITQQINCGDDIATWVQAIASVVTILAMFLIVQWQRCIDKKKAEKTRNDLVKNYLAAAINFAAGTIEKAKLLDTWCNQSSVPYQNLTYMRAELEAITAGLRNIPMWELGKFELITGISSIQSLSNLVLEVLKDAEDSVDSVWQQSARVHLATLIPELEKYLIALVAAEKTQK